MSETEGVGPAAEGGGSSGGGVASASFVAEFYRERYRGAMEAAGSLRTAKGLVMVATLLGAATVVAVGVLHPNPLALVVAVPAAVVVLLVGVSVGLLLGAGSSTLFLLTDLAITWVPGLGPGQRSDLIVGSAALDEVEDQFTYSAGDGPRLRLNAKQVAWRVAAEPAADHRVWGLGGWEPAREVGAIARLLR